MGILVSKFGGTSLSDGKQFHKTMDILRMDERRRYVVPSAPGKRHSGDTKVTDLLLTCWQQANEGSAYEQTLGIIAERFDEIISELGITLNLTAEFQEIIRHLSAGASRDYIASRGEYLSGKVLSAALNWHFIDPADCICFDSKGKFLPELTNTRLAGELGKYQYGVIPGFYGANPDGSIRTFSRGGSDVTGSIVARAAKAELYENWTDVSGFMMADPRIVTDPKVIDVITYNELRELSYMGANVLHEEAIFPVRIAGIPICIRNTNDPTSPGTRIVSQAPELATSRITGVAGLKGLSVISVEKALMNGELGFGRRLLRVLEDNEISFEHMPTGIDTISVIIRDAYLEGKQDKVLTELREQLEPDKIEITSGLSIIATVGRGMVNSRGTAALLFSGLAAAGINILMIDQGSSEINIIVGVKTEDFESAIAAIYNCFV